LNDDQSLPSTPSLLAGRSSAVRWEHFHCCRPQVPPYCKSAENKEIIASVKRIRQVAGGILAKTEFRFYPVGTARKKYFPSSAIWLAPWANCLFNNSISEKNTIDDNLFED
jgi:hypothetical protein